MAALRSLGPPMATGSWSADCWLGRVDGAGGRAAWLLAAGREIDPVMSFFAPSIGGANSDGIAGVVGFKPSGGVVAIAGPPDGEASGPIAGSFGSASGLAAMLAVDSGAASSTAASEFPVFDTGASAVLVVELPRSSTLPAIWADPTTMAMMLAAMNSDLTRFIILARSDGVSRSYASTGSARGARALGCCTAAWAARRAAAIKLDLPPAAAVG